MTTAFALKLKATPQGTLFGCKAVPAQSTSGSVESLFTVCYHRSAVAQDTYYNLEGIRRATYVRAAEINPNTLHLYTGRNESPSTNMRGKACND